MIGNPTKNLAIAGGETTPVMVVDQQVDPIKGTLLHADLKRIDLSKRIRVTVPVHTAGEPKGVKVQGGLLEVMGGDHYGHFLISKRIQQIVTRIDGEERRKLEGWKPCAQCGRLMNPVNVMLGPVCGPCCRENHRRAVRGEV